MSDVGNVEFPRTDIVVNRPITLTNSTSISAGKIVASGPFFGLLQDSVTVSGQLRGLVINNIMRVDKKNGGGTDTIADGEEITFSQVAGQDWYEAVQAVALDPIHAYALEARIDGDTDVLIKGPLEPPFTAHP